MTLHNLGPGAAVLAFDVGGTDIKAALVDRDGLLLGLNRTPTPTPGPGARSAETVAARLAELAQALRARFPGVSPVAAGVTAPGIVDEAEGIGVFSSNLGWRDAPVRSLAEASLGLPVAFTHDVRAAGAVEFRRGAARPFSDVVVIIIGTGLSATVIIGGRPHLAHGYSGEIGHSCVDPRGELCSCGARGCLETVASAGAIARRYTARGGGQTSGARDVVERAASGDPLAQAVWTEAIDALALGISQVTAIIAPEAVVLGGGLSEAGDVLLLPLRARLADLLSFHRRPRLLLGEIGEDAGLLGAALLARDLADGTNAPEAAP
jgi:glucokinase